MAQVYSDPTRESDEHALPDVEVFQLTANEVAALDEEMVDEYCRRPEFRLAAWNSRDCQAMLSTMVEEQGITGGWFYWYCFPGCLPDSEPIGPFSSYAEAKTAAQEDSQS
jgi:hypothetical protein